MRVDKSPDIAGPLLDWYDGHARDLPWRVRPGAPAPDPYATWLSEVMLQQTTVAAAGPYWRRFLDRWPTVADLAAADEGELMAAWAGLGYYARARNLHRAAKAVAAAGGRFPDTEDGLRALPGIGAYTAAAVAAIAFGRRAVVVDGNVERVVSRLFAVGTPMPKAKPLLRACAGTITPDARAGDFAQAMMDLGATICTPRAPRCLICPVAGRCAARAAGDPARYPIKAAKAAKPLRHATAFLTIRDGHALLVRRPDRGLLGGMRGLPMGPMADAPPGMDGAPASLDWRPVGAPVRHVFTHFALSLQLAEAEGEAEGEWWPLDRIGEAGLPTLFRRVLAARP